MTWRSALMQGIPADLPGGVSGKPLAHLVVGPIPRERVGVAAVVLRPRGGRMFAELLPVAPGRAPQVAPPEGADEQLRLVQPGGVGGRRPGPPPGALSGEVVLRRLGGVAGAPSWIKKAPRSQPWRRRKSSCAAV